MFGKTYGKITDSIAQDAYHVGPDVQPVERYTSLNRQAYCDLTKVHDKKVAEVVGVCPPPEIYKAPIPKKIQYDFFGVGTEPEKPTFDLYAESQKAKGGSGGDGAGQGGSGAQGGQKQVMKIGEPIPGYTGMNRRLVADNVFGLTYANARR